MSQKEITFVSHRLDKRGGQERSTHEVLSRLLAQGFSIHLICFSIENWDVDHPNTSIHLVPGKKIKIQLLKNLWFSIYTFIYLFFKPQTQILTIGVSSWIADVRLIQFLHKPYYNKVRVGEAILPNATNFFKSFYQHIFALWTITLENILFPRTRSFIVISDRIRLELLEHFNIDLKRTKIETIHHAGDSQPQPLKQAKLPKTILFVGALERKGIEKALEILKLCHDLPWVFHAVGDGDLNRWRKRAQELGIDDRVTFHGIKPSASYFLEADIFLFPSTYEPFGLVVSESISAGVFPLASMECGSMELWSDRDASLVLSAQDSTEKWARTLRRLLEDHDFFTHNLEQASQSMLQRNWDDVALSYNSNLSSTGSEKIEITS